MAIIGVAVTVIGIIITWYYTKKSNHKLNEEIRNKLEKTEIELRENKKVLERLPDEVKKIISESNAEKLTIKELNRLINEKVIDDKSSEILPYKLCPKCGSENIEKEHGADVDVDKDGIFLTHNICNIRCSDCGWYKEEHYR